MCVNLEVHHPTCKGRETHCSCQPLTNTSICVVDVRVFPLGCDSFTWITVFEGKTFLQKGDNVWLELDGPHKYGKLEAGSYILDLCMAQHHQFLKEYVGLTVWLKDRELPIGWAELLGYLDTRLAGGEGPPGLPRVTEAMEAMVDVLENRSRRLQASASQGPDLPSRRVW